MRDARGWHPTLGYAAIRDRHGDVTWESGPILNTLTDQGEQNMLQTYFAEQAHTSKYLALLNQSSATDPLDADTIATVTETKVAGVGGYARAAVASGDWAATALVSNDYRIALTAGKVFGAFTSVAASVSHVALVTTSTGLTSPTTLFLIYWPLGATLTIPIGETFTFTPAFALA